MRDKSFREILAENMTLHEGPEATAPPSIQAQPSMEMPFWLNFRMPPPQRPSATEIYPRAAAIPKPKTPPPPPKAEPSVDAKQLTTDELASVRTLGLALESGKIELRAVKHCYRKLMIALHPDRSPAHLSAQEREARLARFHNVRAAYQTLTAAFKR